MLLWRKWQSSPVVLPGKSHTQKNLVGYSPLDCKRVRYNLLTKQQWFKLALFELFSNWSNFGHWEVLNLVFVVISRVAPSFVDASILSFILKYSSLILFFSYPGPFQHQLFLQGVLVPFTPMIFKFQDLRVKCVYCYWEEIVSRPPQRTKLGNRCMCNNTWIHTTVYFCNYPSVCVYIYIFFLRKLSSFWYVLFQFNMTIHFIFSHF